MPKDSSARYYQKKNKEFVQKKSCERYQSFSEEGKNKKRECGCKRFENSSENEKQKLVDYRKKYYEMRKNKN